MKLTPVGAALRDWYANRGEQTIALLPGPAGTGKTHAAITTLVRDSLTQRAGVYMLCGQTTSSVIANTEPAFRQLADESGITLRLKRSGDVPQFQFGKATFRIYGGQKQDSASRFRGLNAYGAFVDEATLLHRGFLNDALSRVRKGNAITIVATNPDSPMSPFKTEWLDKAEEKGIAVINSAFGTNPYIGETGYAAMRQMSGAAYQRMVEGLWAANEGLVFPEWHTWMDDGGKGMKVAGVDYGAAGTTAAVLLTQQPGGWWLATDEFYHDQRTHGVLHDPQLAAMMAAKFGRGVADWAVDPSAVTLRRAMIELGLPAHSANNEVGPGIQTVNLSLQLKRLMLKHIGLDGLKAEMAAYRWDERPGVPTDGEKPVKEKDHLCDALRYAVIEWLPKAAQGWRADWQ